MTPQFIKSMPKSVFLDELLSWGNKHGVIHTTFDVIELEDIQARLSNNFPKNITGVVSIEYADMTITYTTCDWFPVIDNAFYRIVKQEK